jgi:hypothetical protein
MINAESNADLINRGDAADAVHDRRLFPTPDELGLAPLMRPHRHDDLSRIRVVDRESPEGQEILRRRALWKERRDLIDGVIGPEDLALAGKL